MKAVNNAGDIYRDAMCTRGSCAGKEYTQMKLNNALNVLSTYPLTDSVITDGFNTVVNVEQAITHIKHKLELLQT
ncbi:MAG: hypothetical protein CML21_00405 [Rheinheimera sp.]|nr:hypothetical protein [Rheinheimera sp.]|tara:strand:- start:309 stop:533 length:225 start_codon:yes stop_codon:yes gene_type:complete